MNNYVFILFIILWLLSIFGVSGFQSNNTVTLLQLDIILNMVLLEG